MISFTLNERRVSVDADGKTPLLWVIRDQVGLTGTKYGCGAGLCGACTVHVDGKAVRSCQTTVSDAADKKVERITMKDGSVQQTNFHDYDLMRMSDLPEEMHVQFVESDARPTGLGEIGNPFIAGAISNAVHRLTGKRLRHLPFTPDRVLQTLKA